MPTGSPWAGASEKGGVAKTAIFYLYASISRNRYEIQPKLPLMTHRKSDVRFRLAPRSMTLDDLEMENNLFSSFRRQYLVNSIHRCRTLTSASGRLSWLHSFSNLDRCRSIRVKCFAFLIKSRSAPTHLRKIRLSHAHLCCRRSLFTCKRGRGLWCSVQTRTRWPHPLRPERSVRSFSLDWIDLIWQI